MWTPIVVPRPGALSTARLPPSSSARSPMPSRPKPPDGPGLEPLGSKPTPSSATSRLTPSSKYESVTSTFMARRAGGRWPGPPGPPARRVTSTFGWRATGLAGDRQRRGDLARAEGRRNSSTAIPPLASASGRGPRRGPGRRPGFGGRPLRPRPGAAPHAPDRPLAGPTRWVCPGRRSGLCRAIPSPPPGGPRRFANPWASVSWISRANRLRSSRTPASRSAAARSRRVRCELRDQLPALQALLRDRRDPQRDRERRRPGPGPR